MKVLTAALLFTIIFSCKESDDQSNLIYDEYGIIIELEFVNQNTGNLTKDLRLIIHLPEDLTVYNGQDSTSIQEYHPNGLYKIEVELLYNIDKRMDYTLKIYSIINKSKIYSIDSFFHPGDPNVIQMKATVNKEANNYMISELGN